MPRSSAAPTRPWRRIPAPWSSTPCRNRQRAGRDRGRPAPPPSVLELRSAMQLRLVAAALLAAGLYAGISILIPLSRADDAYSGGDPKRGEQIFSNNGCGWCHEGMGRQAGRGPALMDTKRTDIFLATRIMNGKAGSM